MIVYLDLIWLLNFGFDLLLLITTAVLLKRDIKFFRIIFAALVGSLSIFTMFYPMNSITLFSYKVIFSLLMILITFGYKNLSYFLKNIAFLYIVSVFLGGALYFLNIQLSYRQEGLIFFHRGISMNWVILIVATPILLYLYYKQSRTLKLQTNQHYKVMIQIGDTKISLTALLDSGNKLYDPYLHRPIILVQEEFLVHVDLPKIYVPYNALNHSSMLECIKVDELEIMGVGKFKDCIVGLSKNKLQLNDVNCILHPYYF